MTKSRNIVGASTYQRIKRDIIFGDLAPGAKLKLDGLRERYAASMSTLRETLNRLASEGFVDAQDQRGFFVHLMEKKMLSGDDSQKEDWKRYDWEFHLALIQACGSRNLLSLHSVLYDKYLRYQMLVLTNRGEEAVIEHRKILDAALERDIDKAALNLKAHIENGLAHTLAAF